MLPDRVSDMLGVGNPSPINYEAGRETLFKPYQLPDFSPIAKGLEWIDAHTRGPLVAAAKASRDYLNEAGPSYDLSEDISRGFGAAKDVWQGRTPAPSGQEWLQSAGVTDPFLRNVGGQTVDMFADPAGLALSAVSALKVPKAGARTAPLKVAAEVADTLPPAVRPMGEALGLQPSTAGALRASEQLTEVPERYIRFPNGATVAVVAEGDSGRKGFFFRRSVREPWVKMNQFKELPEAIGAAVPAGNKFVAHALSTDAGQYRRRGAIPQPGMEVSASIINDLNHGTFDSSGILYKPDPTNITNRHAGDAGSYRNPDGSRDFGNEGTDLSDEALAAAIHFRNRRGVEPFTGDNFNQARTHGYNEIGYKVTPETQPQGVFVREGHSPNPDLVEYAVSSNLPVYKLTEKLGIVPSTLEDVVPRSQRIVPRGYRMDPETMQLRMVHPWDALYEEAHRD